MISTCQCIGSTCQLNTLNNFQRKKEKVSGQREREREREEGEND